ncbi:CAP-Gly domain-containing linker protein 1-like [Diaphorina citri]|uniref:CAP-Gly domain-containing linker protein 1-like n=1 Tax=Diaphorina citri TaxID=121845 RepID=A0A3Q0IUZ7_DIACI|nr:CAP-Gly domain-containing linker protein 1-like [Diaphorina citri]
MTGLQEELERAKADLEKAREEGKRLKTERAKVEAEEKNAKNQSELASQLEKSNKLIKQLTAVTAEQKERADKLEATLKTRAENETENESLKKTVQELRSALQAAEAKSAATASNKSDLEDLRRKLSEVEKDKTKLETQLSELKKQKQSNGIANSVGAGDSSGNNEMAKIIEEKEFAESQVNFLNSIIADQQRALEELKATVHALETNPRDPNYGVDSGGGGGKIAGSRVIAPRLFCDICDVFDAHDTDDCPRQGGSSSPPLEQTHVLPRHFERPYCDTCESE